MTPRFEELDWQPTPIGEVSLRRRLLPGLGIEVHEVLLGEEYLMSSLFPVAELALATLALDLLPDAPLDVVVGGLGLGHTARAVLEDPRVRRLDVVEALEAVIGWHRRGLVPLGAGLRDDARCALQHGDFFALVRRDEPFGPGAPQQVDAVLVDIDHTPSHHLDDGHGDFYTPPGLQRVADRLLPGGVFGLWSDAPPDDAFLAVLREVLADVRAEVVPFANPLTGGQSTNTVYLARRTA